MKQLMQLSLNKAHHRRVIQYKTILFELSQTVNAVIRTLDPSLITTPSWLVNSLKNDLEDCVDVGAKMTTTKTATKQVHMVFF